MNGNLLVTGRTCQAQNLTKSYWSLLWVLTRLDWICNPWEMHWSFVPWREDVHIELLVVSRCTTRCTRNHINIDVDVMSDGISVSESLSLSLMAVLISQIAFAAHLLRHSDIQQFQDPCRWISSSRWWVAWTGLGKHLTSSVVPSYTWNLAKIAAMPWDFRLWSISNSSTPCSVRWLRKRTHEEADPWLLSLWICVGFECSRCSSV